MKGIFGYIFYASFLLVGLGTYLFLSKDFASIDNAAKGVPVEKVDRQMLRAAPESAKNALGSKDDPYARLSFQQLKYRDPNSGVIPHNIRERELSFVANLPKGYSLNLRKGSNERSDPSNIVYESRGPANVGGRTRALALDVSDVTGNTVLAGGISGGMWRSTNGGEDWVRTTALDQLPSVSCVVQDERVGSRNVWYYGTGELVGNSASQIAASYRGDGIFKSTDGGVSWSVLDDTFQGDVTNIDNDFRFVYNLAINESNASQTEVYAAVINGIIRTTDDFENYSYVLGGRENINNLHTDIAVTSTGVFYAAISDESNTSPNTSPNIDTGISTSTDGINWTSIALPAGIPTSGFQRTSIAISPSDEDIVYFFRTEGNGTFTLLRYDAGSGQFSDRSASVPNDGGIVGDFSTQGSYNQFIEVHPDDEDIVFLGGINLYRSTNGFADQSTTQWIGGYSEFRNNNSRIGLYFNHHPDQHALVFDPNDSDRVFSSHDGGVSVTTDILKTSVTQIDEGDDGSIDDEAVVIWTNLNNKYLTSQFHAIAIEKNDLGDDFIIGGLQDNSTHVTTDSSPDAPWFDVFGGDGSYCDATYNSYYFSAQFAQVIRFDRFTGDFFDISPPGSGDLPFSFINPMVADAVSPDKVYVAGNEKLFFSYDVTFSPSSFEWEEFTDGLTGQGNITALAPSTNPQNKLIFGTEAGRVLRIEDTDDPSGVTDITGSNFPNDIYINNIAVDPKDANSIFVVFTNYGVLSIFHTTNGGASWTAVSGNLEENADGSGNGPSVRWVSILPNGDDNVYFAGTSTGLYSTQSLNGASTVWKQEGADVIGNVVVDMVHARPSDGYMVVGTHGNGVFQAEVDVPLYVNIYRSGYPCRDGQVVLFGNQVRELASDDFDFEYTWILNGQEIPINDGGGNPVNSPNIIAQQDGEYQLEVRNAVNGEVALSNVITITFSDQTCDELITGVRGEQPEAKLLIYPNPGTGAFNLSFKDDFKDGTQLLVYDLEGSLLMSKEVSGEELNTKVVPFDISHLANGQYAVMLNDGTRKVTKRLSKVSR